MKADHCRISAPLMHKDREKQTASLIFFISCIAEKVILFSVKSLSVVNYVWEIFCKIEEKVKPEEIQPHCMFFTFIMRTQLITVYTVGPLLSGHLLSGHPPLSGHFPKSRIIILSVKCCIQYLYSTANLY